MAAVLDWRLPELAPTDPGPLPWLPGIPATLHDHPVWGTYLAKRSQLVADLADQVQDHACQGDAQPVWAPPGSHPSTALIGEIAVWRAANGINPQDPRPTGGTQLETLPALWKQRLDRDIARATNPPADARADERHAGRTALSPATTGSARTKDPNGVRAGRPRPADSTPQSSNRGAQNMRLHSARRWQDRQHTAESGSFRSRRRASAARPAPRVLLRAGLAPAFCGRGDVTQGRRAAGARARGACTRPAGCGRRRSGARSSRGRRPGSRRRCVLRPWPR